MIEDFGIAVVGVANLDEAGWRTAYDINDLGTMADNWMHILTGQPPIGVTISGDPNNLNGDITIGVAGYGVTTEHAFVLVDGDYLQEVVDLDEGGYVMLDTRSFRNGQHIVKAVAVDGNNAVALSENTAVDFNNALCCVSSGDNFVPGTDYQISAIYSSGEELRVKVVDWNDSMVWTSAASSGYINSVIPSTVFSGQVYNGVVAKTDEFAIHIGVLRPGWPTGEAIFIGWKYTVNVNDSDVHYNKWETNLWKYLGQGSNLEMAIEFAGDGVQGRSEIEDNFTYYGVADGEFAFFRYPDIN